MRSADSGMIENQSDESSISSLKLIIKTRITYSVYLLLALPRTQCLFKHLECFVVCRSYVRRPLFSNDIISETTSNTNLMKLVKVVLDEMRPIYKSGSQQQ